MTDNVQLNLGVGGAVMRAVNKSGIDTPTVIIDLGGAGAENLLTGSMPVTVADGANVTFGSEADAAASSDTATATYISLFKRLLQHVTSLIGQLPTSLTGSGNLKVALAESTATQAVSGSVSVTGTVAISDAAQLPAALGQTTMSASLPVTVASDQSAIPVKVVSGTTGGTSTYRRRAAQATRS